MNKSMAPPDNMLAFAVAIFYFSVSIYIGGYYIYGDQEYYRYLYDNVWKFPLGEAYEFYGSVINSKEYGHFFLIWLFGRFFEKDLFVAISNAVMAYLSYKVAVKFGMSRVLAVLFIATNYYFYILMFPAERLKYAFIFILAAAASNRKFVTVGWVVLSVLSHIQVLIMLASLAITSGYFSLRFVFSNFLYSALAAIALCLGLYLVVPQIIAKSSLLDLRDVQEMLRFLVFFIVALVYGKDKKIVVLAFVPLMFATLLLGGGRVHMISFFVSLYFSCGCRGGWNLGFLILNGYFAYQAYDFVIRVIKYGSAFSL